MNIEEGLEARNNARIWVYMIMGAFGLCVIGWNGMRMTSPAFCGELVREYPNSDDPDSFDSLQVLEIRQDDGTVVEWKVDDSTAHYYKIGDYLVKEKRERYPAVFRQGKQVKSPGIRMYKEADVDLAAARARFKPSGSATSEAIAEAREERDPATSPPAVPAPPIAPTEERAKALLEEAGRLWGKGDKAGALAKSEEALKVRLAIYGEKHPLIDDAKRRIEAAKKQM